MKKFDPNDYEIKYIKLYDKIRLVYDLGNGQYVSVNDIKKTNKPMYDDPYNCHYDDILHKLKNGIKSEQMLGQVVMDRSTYNSIIEKLQDEYPEYFI